MAMISLLSVSFLSALCYAQSSSSSSVAAYAAASSSSNAATVTVTSVSTLAIVILPSSSTQSSTTPYSYSSTTSTGYLSSTLTTAPPLTSTAFALQTVPYTGQPMLVGTCDIPQYTALPFPDGSMLEVPLVGCSDDRPDCCPSLALPPSNASQPAVTNVVSLLNQAPLSICPKDFIDIDPVCCPSGYSLYGQGIVGQTPCYTMISTTMTVPQTVLASISSAVAETISAKSTTAAVSVIINQVFALSLPCADDGSSSSGLSTGAKAGIGVGAAVGGLILITLAIWLCFFARKRRQRKAAQAQAAAGPATHYSGVPGQMHDKQYPMFPPGSPQSAYPILPGQGSPPVHQQGFAPQPWLYQPQAHAEHMSISSDGTRQYAAASPGLPPGYVTEMDASAYRAQARSQTHEMPDM